MGNQYNDLLVKIDEFIRRFYLNKILRGSIYCATLLLALYLILFVSTYFLHPEIWVKTLIFYAFLTVSVLSIFFLIIRPLLSLLKLGKHLSFEEASVLIGEHFTDIRDKLLNTLQLHRLADSTPENNRLILASIDQKIIELRPIPFYSAIHIDENKKYLKYLLVPLSVILLIGILSPRILREGTHNFVRYNEYIAPRAPFSFDLVNEKLTVTQGDDLTLLLKLNGNEIPQDVYVLDGKNTYKLERENISRFHYTFKNIQSDKILKFTAGGFSSADFKIRVKPRPSLLNVSAQLIYPAYLHKSPENIAHVGDMIFPEGTKVTWQVKTENSNSLIFVLNDQAHALPVANNLSSFSSAFRTNARYRVFPKNSFSSSSDSISYQIQVIKDQFPTISVTEKPDSLSNKALYFTGQLSDDYGISRLSFHYAIKDAGNTLSKSIKSIAIPKNQPASAFFYFLDLKALNLLPGQTLEYYFEVADNDGLNGPKSSHSEIKTYHSLSKQQLAEKIDAGSRSLKQKMQTAIRMATAVEKESKKIAESLLDKKELSFDEKKQIEQVLEKKKQLDQAVQEIKDLNERNGFEQQESRSMSKEMAEKQKQIKDLFDQVLDEKTKELLQKLQSLMEQNSKEQTRSELSKMQLDNKTLRNELDRILELYKQLEFEQSLQNNINRLNDLAKEQQLLAEQSQKANPQTSGLKSKQSELNKEFQALKADLKKLEEKNGALERPGSYQSPEPELQNIQKLQQESSNQLERNSPQRAAENQQKAAQQMQDVARKMNEMQQQGAEMENTLNVHQLRKLLENLLNTSFEQEKLMLAFKRSGNTDPSYNGQVQKQRILKDNLKTIADSLYALSKRVPQIETTVNEEMNRINFNLDKSLENLSDRNTPEALRNQQLTLTSVNNLALMLNEALEQLQKMMKNAKAGGKGQKQSMQQLSQMQQQLNNNMEKARQQMQNTGNQGNVPKGQMSQEFAKMAQQQQLIREALEKLNQEENKDGSGKLGNLNQAIKDMKQTESDLVNKRLQQEMIQRQKDLLTRMLEAEKAEREQEQDTKRESNAGKDLPPSYQKMLEQFKKEQQNGTDLLQKVPPSFNYYYKNKVAEYFKSLNLKPSN